MKPIEQADVGDHVVERTPAGKRMGVVTERFTLSDKEFLAINFPGVITLVQASEVGPTYRMRLAYPREVAAMPPDEDTE